MSVASPAPAVGLAGRKLTILGGMITTVLFGVAARHGPHRNELHFPKGRRAASIGVCRPAAAHTAAGAHLNVALGSSLIELQLRQLNSTAAVTSAYRMPIPHGG
jgi:hypothetical protein